MVLGVICIRLHRYINRDEIARLVIEEKNAAESVSSKEDKPVVEGHQSSHHDDTTVITSTCCLPCPLTRDDSFSPSPEFRCRWLKYLHGIFMFYSYVMIVGAGMAFTSNSRQLPNFPYPPGALTDSLLGRCYGRDLTPSAPSWLTSLKCGSLLCSEVPAMIIANKAFARAIYQVMECPIYS